MRTIEVVAAIIRKNDLILCTQRSFHDKNLSLKWEFPGGKIEKNETDEQALVREIQEELNVDIIVNNYFMTINHRYAKFYLVMKVYECTLINGSIKLLEHNSYKWLKLSDLESLDWVEADIPIIENLKKNNTLFRSVT